MLRPHVVVVLLSPFSRLDALRAACRCIVLLVTMGLPVLAAADEVSPATGYVADIELQTETDFGRVLTRAERLFDEGELDQSGSAVVLVLHGPVLRSLLRPNYTLSKGLVNQAASLSALGVLEVKACRSWMDKNGVDERLLQPFVEVVPYGAEEVSSLIEDRGYIRF